MTNPATPLQTSGKSEEETARATGGTQVRPPEIWKSHFDYGFFKLGQVGTAGDQEGNQSPTIVSDVDNHEGGLPEDLSQRLSVREPYIASFHTLQKWDGYVLVVKSESFTARLTDIMHDGQPDGEEVEIPFDELDDESRAQIAPGRLFRWSIGYERSRSGQKRRVSRIAVRRLPTWTAEELKQAREEAAQLSKDLKWT